MRLHGECVYVHADNSQSVSMVDFNIGEDGGTPRLIEDLSCVSKKDLPHRILEAMQANALPLLYDASAASLSSRVKNLQDSSLIHHRFEEVAALFFTSGTTGEPLGVIKSLENLKSEIEAQEKLWGEIERVVVCVPIFHLYGFLLGFLYPLMGGRKVFYKEHFLPQDLFRLAKEPKTLVVANPVFIRMLLRFAGVTPSLKGAIFMSSTGVLMDKEIRDFQDRYQADLFQLYGSTESGGIGYQKGDSLEGIWRPLECVTLSLGDEQRLLVRSPFVSKRAFEMEEVVDLPDPLVTSDVAEMTEEGFRLLGRVGELIKIGGKRYSLLEVEREIERLEGVTEALARVVLLPDSLKGEAIVLEIVSQRLITTEEAANAIGGVVGSKINPMITIHAVEHIPKTATGKKIRKKISFS